jgi:chaperone required for assembly of F1-ATPase
MEEAPATQREATLIALKWDAQACLIPEIELPSTRRIEKEVGKQAGNT